MLKNSAAVAGLLLIAALHLPNLAAIQAEPQPPTGGQLTLISGAEKNVVRIRSSRFL